MDDADDETTEQSDLPQSNPLDSDHEEMMVKESIPLSDNPLDQDHEQTKDSVSSINKAAKESDTKSDSPKNNHFDDSQELVPLKSNPFYSELSQETIVSESQSPKRNEPDPESNTVHQSMREFLDGVLCKNDNNLRSISYEEAMDDIKVIGFYFAAKSTLESHKFTDTLRSVYFQWQLMSFRKCIEIIAVPQNLTEEQYKEELRDRHGRWLALKWDSDRQNTLINKWNVKDPPTLVFVNKQWDVLSLDGVSITKKFQYGEMSECELKTILNLFETEEEKNGNDPYLSESGAEDVALIPGQDAIASTKWWQCLCCCKKMRTKSIDLR